MAALLLLTLLLLLQLLLLLRRGRSWSLIVIRVEARAGQLLLYLRQASLGVNSLDELRLVRSSAWSQIIDILAIFAPCTRD